MDYRRIGFAFKLNQCPSVAVLGRLRSRASFVPSKIISAESGCRAISGEPGEYGMSWRVTIGYG